MVAVNVVTFEFLILVVSHVTEGKASGGFGHSCIYQRRGLRVHGV